MIFAQSDVILVQSIPYEMFQHLPSALTRIEEEAFAGTAFLAVDIPASVSYIADDAFVGSNIRMIVGHNEYVKQYAVDHKIYYRGP